MNHSHANDRKRTRSDEDLDIDNFPTTFSYYYPQSLSPTRQTDIENHTPNSSLEPFPHLHFQEYDPRIALGPSALGSNRYPPTPVASSPTSMTMSSDTTTENHNPNPNTVAFKFVDGFTPVPSLSTGTSKSKQQRQRTGSTTKTRSRSGTTRTFTAEELADLRAQRAIRAAWSKERKKALQENEMEIEMEMEQERQREQEQQQAEQRELERQCELKLEATRLTTALKGIEDAGYPTLRAFLDALLKLTVTTTTNGTDLRAESELGWELETEASQVSLPRHPLFANFAEEHRRRHGQEY